MRQMILFALLLLVGCTAPIQTAYPTQSKRPTPTASVTSRPSATASPTITLTLTPTASPTITLTPAPTWTPWQIDMDWSPDLPLAFNPKNPVQDCMLTYFDLVLAPGHLRVWRRDNGGYIRCMLAIP